MLEQLFNTELATRRPAISFLFGAVFSLIGLGVSMLFFRSSVSVSMIFLTTLLLVPMLVKLIDLEEARERKYGTKNFFHNHKDVAEVYFFTFLGVFAGYLLIGLFASQLNMFQFQNDILLGQEGIDDDAVASFYQVGEVDVVNIISNNLLVVSIAFVLSFFYGASAIFLLVLNASVFARFTLFLIDKLSTSALAGIKIVSFMLIHLTPELTGFFLAAMAGGVVSKALMAEKRGTKRFSNVMKDAALLLLCSFCLIVIAAVLEAYVTANLFLSFV